MRVGDDRNLPVDEREAHLFAHQIFVALVVGVDHDGGVAEVGFRTGRRHNHMPLFARQRVADVVELALMLFVLHLDVAERPVVGTPVDHVVAPDDEPLFVKLHEGFAHGVFEPFVHREALPAPGGRDAQFAHLMDDGAAAKLLPFPNPLQKGVAPQLLFGLALGQQLLFDDILGGDARMVGPRLPEGLVAVHPLVTDHDVLQRECQRMADMEAPGDIGRGHHDTKALTLFLNLSVSVDFEIAAILPDFVVRFLDGVGIVVVLFLRLAHKTSLYKIAAIIAKRGFCLGEIGAKRLVRRWEGGKVRPWDRENRREAAPQ